MTASLGPGVLALVRDVEAALARFRLDLEGLYGEEQVMAVPELRGERQEQVARAVQLAGEDGATATEIGRQINYDEPNTYTVLAALDKAGLIEGIPAATPKRWRVAAEHRRNRVFIAAEQIRAGEWTTYGDIAVAVWGNKLGARAVGRMAAKLPVFPNPHRVLQQGGLIPSGWRAFGGGPEECERRLRQEGVSVIDGRAPSERRVVWEQIEERLREQSSEVAG